MYKKFKPEMSLDEFQVALWGKVFVKHLKAEDLNWLLTSKNARSRIGPDINELKREGTTIYGIQYEWEELDESDKMAVLYNLISNLTEAYEDVFNVKTY